MMTCYGMFPGYAMALYPCVLCYVTGMCYARLPGEYVVYCIIIGLCELPSRSVLAHNINSSSCGTRHKALEGSCYVTLRYATFHSILFRHDTSCKRNVMFM